MVDPIIGDIVAAIGDSVVKDSEFMNTESKTKSTIIRVLYYLIPLSILVGFYSWTVYY